MALSLPLIADRYPYLPMRVTLGTTLISIEALLDTGFDGDVALPVVWFSDRPADAFLPWGLADGTEVFTPAYDALVEVGDFAAIPGVAIALGDEPLVGRGVAAHYMIHLDHGQRLIVEG